MSLLSESTAKVEQDIIKFLNTNSIEKWNTLDMIKQILSKYLIIDTASDAIIVSNLYESALDSFENHPDFEKANKAKRRKPVIEKQSSEQQQQQKQLSSKWGPQYIHRPPSFFLKNLGAEEALRYIVDSKDCKDNVVDFTKHISKKKIKPAISKIVEHYKFDLESAITLRRATHPILTKKNFSVHDRDK
ncbi:hypothetical protein BD408DRAFT_437949 [Parasitella parasitica]|nr:hypothetical protein BD408DRAFT_437949 [Parasitella parasitica]